MKLMESRATPVPAKQTNHRAGILHLASSSFLIPSGERQEKLCIDKNL